MHILRVRQGSAVAMPWVNDVKAIIQAWYSGNEVGNALSDVIYGAVNPSGRLPLTLPVRGQDIPAYLNTHSENGEIHYREDLFVGYKWYQARDIKPLFPFGCALFPPLQVQADNVSCKASVSRTQLSSCPDSHSQIPYPMTRPLAWTLRSRCATLGRCAARR